MIVGMSSRPKQRCSKKQEKRLAQGKAPQVIDNKPSPIVTNEAGGVVLAQKEAETDGTYPAWRVVRDLFCKLNVSSDGKRISFRCFAETK